MKTRMIDISSSNIIIHKEVSRPEGLNKKVSDFFKPSSSIDRLYPPFFLDEGEQLILISRYWVLADAINKEQSEILGFIAENKDLEQIQQQDRDEIAFFSNLKRKENPSRSTSDRRKNRASGRTCPVCGGILRRPRHKADRIRNNFNLIRCENNVQDEKSKYFGKRCDFEMQLSDTEHKQLLSHELSVNDLIIPINSSKCKEGKPLFKRTYHSKDRIKVFELCSSKFSSRVKCNCEHKKLVSQTKL